MASREPVLLTVLIECGAHRWRAAAINHAGGVAPLACSEPGNLAPYVGQPFDDQVSFLRHRLSGVLQRGCDRLWGRDQKPCRIVLAADAPFPDAPAGLTQRVADHFVEWMTSPPVVFLLLNDQGGSYETLAGGWAEGDRAAFDAGLVELLASGEREEVWEQTGAEPRK